MNLNGLIPSKGKRRLSEVATEPPETKSHDAWVDHLQRGLPVCAHTLVKVEAMREEKESRT